MRRGSRVNTTQNPADVCTRETASKNPESVKLWLERPEFLLQENVDISPKSVPVVCRTLNTESSHFDENGLNKIFKSAGSLFTLRQKVKALNLKNLSQCRVSGSGVY